MKESISRSDDSTRSSKRHFLDYMSFAARLKTRAFFLTAFIVCFFACKSDTEPESNPGVPKKTSASISGAQPLPGGKARFTWVNGNFDTNSYTWQRIVQLSFTASTGTVAATAWTWKSAEKKGKSTFNSHFCTFDGVSKTCSTYTPWGWVYPTGQYQAWSGSYTYNGTTLTITWSSPSFAAGATESWTISNPNTALARASLISSSYTLTHGRTGVWKQRLMEYI